MVTVLASTHSGSMVILHGDLGTCSSLNLTPIVYCPTVRKQARNGGTSLTFLPFKGAFSWLMDKMRIGKILYCIVFEYLYSAPRHRRESTETLKTQGPRLLFGTLRKIISWGPYRCIVNINEELRNTIQDLL